MESLRLLVQHRHPVSCLLLNSHNQFLFQEKGLFYRLVTTVKNYNGQNRLEVNLSKERTSSPAAWLCSAAVFLFAEYMELFPNNSNAVQARQKSPVRLAD